MRDDDERSLQELLEGAIAPDRFLQNENENGMRMKMRMRMRKNKKKVKTRAKPL
jgi:hypothetical protein